MPLRPTGTTLKAVTLGCHVQGQVRSPTDRKVWAAIVVGCMRYDLLVRSLVVFLLLIMACRATAPARPSEPFWEALMPLCGSAFEGRLTEGTEPSDAAIGAERLVMHVLSCSNDEVRIPFHVGPNRSRTWVVTRTPSGVRLKHDHRHEDGTPDRITQYGGDTRDEEGDSTLEFYADEHTAQMIPAASANIWTLAIQPGKTFAYGLRREATGRRFRVEFDLTRPVPVPPTPW